MTGYLDSAIKFVYLCGGEFLNYFDKREELYGSIRGVFAWDWMYDNEYALASIHYITEEFRSEIAYATEELGKLYAKTVNTLQQGPDELLSMLGLPHQALGAVRVPVFSDIVTIIGRFDFAQTNEGLKMLEFNADTPTSVVEAFYVNAKASEYLCAANPNVGVENDLAHAFRHVAEKYKEMGFETNEVVFSSLSWHEEDRGTTDYLLRQSGLEGKFVPLEDLRVYEDRLCYNDGKNYQPINVWYRLHALEKLAEEKDEDGYPTGEHVLDLIARRRLAIINPPSAFIAQTKGVQCLIWGLYEEGQFYTEHEREIIKKYMLPTYFENKFIGNSSYVTKPIYGREGGAISLFNQDGVIIDQDKEEFYWEQPMVYQKMVELEEIQTDTISGPYKGRALWGSFLAGGKASACSLRIGDLITGNLSCFLPVGYKKLNIERGT
ncbi:MAG: glutathionylspermidine synthase family protein [Desulfitobacterium hafniense]|nr:glutathionylspermidine synthase family protein [Desulfitobacterium hafniense]